MGSPSSETPERCSPYSGSGVLKAIANATSLPGSLAAAATVDEGLSAWGKQQEKTIQAIEPVTDRNEKNLISEIPDLVSLSPEDTYSWLSAIHPGAHITLPRTDYRSRISDGVCRGYFLRCGSWLLRVIGPRAGICPGSSGGERS